MERSYTLTVHGYVDRWGPRRLCGRHVDEYSNFTTVPVDWHCPTVCQCVTTTHYPLLHRIYSIATIVVALIMSLPLSSLIRVSNEDAPQRSFYYSVTFANGQPSPLPVGTKLRIVKNIDTLVQRARIETHSRLPAQESSTGMVAYGMCMFLLNPL